MAMFPDTASRHELLEALAGTKEHAEDEEAKALIEEQCENKVTLMTENDFEKLVLAAAEDLPEV
ncbi:MAG: hypothetical protein QM296_11055 [Bacillota bacterium]|nr:hypothetical protein [Bacillota bacterium]